MNTPFCGARHYFLHRLCPALLYGATGGTVTAAIVVAYKYAAAHIIHWSGMGYEVLRRQPLWLVAVLPVLIGLAWLFATAYKRQPNLKGGGIPTSIGIIRDFITFRWLSNLIGTFVLSLGSFLLGVPLGNEGPSVQIGTAVGRGCVRVAGIKGRPWDRYAMTGGACAGFATATGAPVSGLLFAIEEAHQRVTPLLVTVAATAVAFARVTSSLLCPLLNVSDSLFGTMSFDTLATSQLWIPVLVGVAVGLFGVLFLRYYRFLSYVSSKTLGALPLLWKIAGIFLLTLLAGLVSSAFISTGHHLLEELFHAPAGAWMLMAILLVRSTLTLSANAVGITGGLFLPLMAVGAIPAALLAQLLIAIGAIDSSLAPLLLALGVTASISGIMKTPLTAILFALEALSLGSNVLVVIVVTIAAYVMTEIFGAKSVTDCVLEARLEQSHAHKRRRVREIYVTVKSGSFADGKAVNDILWPGQLTVLSYQKDNQTGWEDVEGGHLLAAGQRLHLRYTVFGHDETVEQIAAIVGSQPSHPIDCDET